MTNIMKALPSALAAVVVFAAPFATLAQNARQLQPNEMPTNLPGATTIAAPPASFNPINASDQDLAYYGFPPRPSQTTEAKQYAGWVKAMSASKTRIAPKLEQTSIFHGPVKPGKNTNPTAVEKNSVASGAASNTSYSYNWSGYVDFSGATSYGNSSFYYVVSDFVVPVAEQAFGACTGGWDWGSAWNGIDGWGSGDVLQSGIEFDAYCSGSTRSAYYSPWYEWYPYGEVRISSLAIAPGDDLFVETWHTSATQGYAYLVNYNTNVAVEVGFTAPSGTRLVGNSAECIVERPSVSGGLANLTNYIADPFWNCYAYTEAGTYYAGAYGTPVDMLDNKGYVISYPTYFGPTSFLMQDQGSAR
jgi:hypothetical protein